MGVLSYSRNFSYENRPDLSVAAAFNASTKTPRNPDENILAFIEQEKKREFDSRPLMDIVQCTTCNRPKPQCICKDGETEEGDAEQETESGTDKDTSLIIKVGQTGFRERVNNLISAGRGYKAVDLLRREFAVATDETIDALADITVDTYAALSFTGQKDAAQELESIAKNWGLDPEAELTYGGMSMTLQPKTAANTTTPASRSQPQQFLAYNPPQQSYDA